MNEANTVSLSHISLRRDSFGRLMLREGHGEEVSVTPVRSFPVSAPREGLSLVRQDGSEAVWIEDMDQLDADNRGLLRDELARREFTPEIQRILAVSSHATPSRWQVETDRGATVLSLRGEEDIRRLPGGMLLIADSNGVHFLIRDVSRLDRPSRKLLDHFL